jgi:hypothetical protein
MRIGTPAYDHICGTRNSVETIVPEAVSSIGVELDELGSVVGACSPQGQSVAEVERCRSHDSRPYLRAARRS